jgi:hypothetical protein
VNPQSSAVPVVVNVVVSDGRGGAASGNITINVVPKEAVKGAKQDAVPPPGKPNSPPILVSLQPQRSSIQAGESVAIEAIATDPDNDRLDYSWEPPERIEGSGPRVVLRTAASDAPTEGSRIIVTLTVLDRRGGSVSQKVLINVTPPSKPNPAPHPTPAAAGNIQEGRGAAQARP